MPVAAHCLSVDVEDYRQILSSRYRGDPGPLSPALERDMERVLEVLGAAKVAATFFVTGTVAEARPDLLRRWAALGHEIGCHGHAHAPVWTMSPAELRAELSRTKRAVENASGTSAAGYRAPVFSIRRDTLWALDVVAECGFEYDSSIVPARTRRYGIGGFDPAPRRYQLPSGQSIVEMPLTVARAWGRLVPVAGGGYFRLFSFGRIRRAVADCQRREIPFVLYCHPYEFSPEPVDWIDLAEGWRQRLVARLEGFKTNLGRAKVPRFVTRLASEFRFGTLGAFARQVRNNGTESLLGTPR
jgi:polysaccharide deacetylase family protein (PEP-CTERM system associated)